MKPSKADAEKILEEACERFEFSQSDDHENKDNHKSDMLFVYSPGSQWPDEVKETRKAWKELCLEFNQLKQFVSQVVNDQRQNRPGIHVHPASGDASQDVAEILQGIIRGIEYDSNAEAIYDSAFNSGVVGGRGWFRICSDYDNDEGFDQVLKLMPIQDANSVFADNSYIQPDGSDREWIFVTQPYSKTEFNRRWPDADPVSWDRLEPGWGTGDETIIVADYYRRVSKKRTMCLLSDGNSGFKDDLPALPEGITIVKEREVDDWSVEWYTIAGGNQVLEQYEWPGTIIPVVCVVGDEMVLDGKRVFQGLTRHARDAQSMLNFGMTQQAIHLSLTPRAPWVMAEGQNEGYEAMWKDANNKNFSALIYKPVTLEGQLVGPPQRTAPAMVAEGWDHWCNMMISMIKSTIGMYESSLGQKGNEVSGRAITARQKQGNTGTFNFVDNLSRAIGLAGKILIEVIPKYYDTQRIIHIVNPDQTRRMVQINQQVPNPDNPLEAIAHNNITVGKYAVVSEAGPSYATKRQETSEALMSFVNSFPPAAQVAGDLIIKSMDVADADLIAERMKMMLPPQIQQAEAAKAQGQKPPDPQIMAAMQEKDQQLQQAVQTMDAMHQKVQELESGAQQKDKQLELEYQYKEKLAEQDKELAARKWEYEMKMKYEQSIDQHKLEIAKAQEQGQLALEKARIDADAKVDVAKIDAETQIMIAGLQPPPELKADSSMEEDSENSKNLILEQQTQLIQAVHKLAENMAKPKKRIGKRLPDGTLQITEV